MLRAEYELLASIRAAAGLRGGFECSAFTDSSTKLEAFEYREKKGFIASRDLDRRFRITPAGFDALRSYEELAEKEAEQEERNAANRKRDEERERKNAFRGWVQWLISTLVSILALYLGAYLAKSTAWFDWVENLFH